MCADPVSTPEVRKHAPSVAQMISQARVNVLVIAEDSTARLDYVQSLRAEGFAVHEIATPGEAEPAARATRFDIAVIDTALDADGLEVAEQLAALRLRPRLVAVTNRPRNGAPLEWLFDVYLPKPCVVDALVDGVRSIGVPPPGTRDLLIVARDRIGIHDVLERFGDTASSVEVRLDRRRGDRRRPPPPARRGVPSFKGQERRRGDRRSYDVDTQLKRNGWAFIGAMNRSLW